MRQDLPPIPEHKVHKKPIEKGSSRTLNYKTMPSSDSAKSSDVNVISEFDFDPVDFDEKNKLSKSKTHKKPRVNKMPHTTPFVVKHKKSLSFY